MMVERKVGLVHDGEEGGVVHDGGEEGGAGP